MESKLTKKLAEIMSEVGYIPKNGRNKFHGYDYATESDVQDAVRDKFAKRHIIMYPDVVDSQTREIQTRKGNTEFIAKVVVEYTVEDGDSGETRKFKMVGEGQDAGDKAIYKAVSGTEKYAIMKLLMIPTGDDPERDETQQTQSKPMRATKEQINKLETLAAKYCELKGEPADKRVEIEDFVLKKGGAVSKNNATTSQMKRAIEWLSKQVTDLINQQSQETEAPLFDKDGNPV